MIDKAKIAPNPARNTDPDFIELSKGFFKDAGFSECNGKEASGVWGVQLTNKQLQAMLDGKKIRSKKVKPIKASNKFLTDQPKRTLQEHIDAVEQMQLRYMLGLKIDSDSEPLTKAELKVAEQSNKKAKPITHKPITGKGRPKKEFLAILMKALAGTIKPED